MQPVTPYALIHHPLTSSYKTIKYVSLPQSAVLKSFTLMFDIC